MNRTITLSDKPARLNGGPLKLGDAVGIAPERTRYPARGVLLSGRVLYHGDVGHPETKRFVIDLETVSAAVPVINANYNHESGEVVGNGKNIRIEGGELVCDVSIIPFKPDDRASEIVYRTEEAKQNGEDDTQYGTSIEFTPAAADVEELTDGETALVNGVPAEGPIYIYRNVIVNAFAVCPGPCDWGTDLTFLKQSEKPMKKLNPKNLPAKAKLSDDETGDGGEPTASNCAELDELIDLFGQDLAIQMLRDGVPIDEARKVAEFNKKWGIVPEPAAEGDGAELNDDEPKTDDEPKKDGDESKDKKDDTAELKATMAKMASMNAKLSADVAKLTASITAKLSADPDGVSSGHSAGGGKELSSKEKYLSSVESKLRAISG